MDKLKHIVRYAVSQVPFYAEKYGEIDFSKPNWFTNLPVLQKSELQNTSYQILSKAFDPADLIKENTSGSSGSALSIYKDRVERIKADLQLWHRRRTYCKNIMSLKTVKFYAYRRKGDELVSDPIYQDGKDLNLSLFDLSDERLRQYFSLIKTLDACWFFAAPSVMVLFADFLQRHQLSLVNVLFIELTGEMLSKQQQDFISRTFGCPCANYYGSREFWGIAYECSHGEMHLFDNNIKAEVLDQDFNPLGYGKEGIFCYTGLQKYAMPLIRYIQGDQGFLKQSTCGCGQTADILCLSGGRITQYITTKNGKTANSILLFYLIEKINQNQMRILQFQFIQKQLDLFEATLLLSSATDDQQAIKQELESLLSSHLKLPITLQVTFVDPSYYKNLQTKHNYFINNTEETS